MAVTRVLPAGGLFPPAAVDSRAACLVGLLVEGRGVAAGRRRPRVPAGAVRGGRAGAGAGAGVGPGGVELAFFGGVQRGSELPWPSVSAVPWALPTFVLPDLAQMRMSIEESVLGCRSAL